MDADVLSGAEPLVVISPHLDDAVFSCGALLAHHPGSTVITVIASTGPEGLPPTAWDKLSRFKSHREAMLTRRHEDIQALGLLQATHIWLDFTDVQTGIRVDVQQVIDALDAALFAAGARTVLIPIGLFHPDHTLTNGAALLIRQHHPELSWFAYEEAVYRHTASLTDARLRNLAEYGLELQPIAIDTQSALDQKRAAVAAYASQVNALEPERDRPDILQPERYWQIVDAPALQKVANEAQSDERVSAVVVTQDRWLELLITLRHLACLPQRPQITVIDNASTDGTDYFVAHEFPAVDYVRLASPVGAEARNIGLRRAAAGYVALCDAGAWWEPGSLRAAADRFNADSTLAVLGGAHGDTPFSAAAAIVRRDTILAVGGFEPRFEFGEEALLAIDLTRAGRRIGTDAAVVAYHEPYPIRDPARHHYLERRNSLWFAWLRQPLPVALARTIGLAFLACFSSASRRALWFAIAGLPWAVRRRLGRRH